VNWIERQKIEEMAFVVKQLSLLSFLQGFTNCREESSKTQINESFFQCNINLLLCRNAHAGRGQLECISMHMLATHPLGCMETIKLSSAVEWPSEFLEQF
jgi:hypothetical protein